MKKINTYKIISKFYAGVLATMLLALPFSLFAQEVPAEASVPAVDSSQTPSAPEFVPAQDPSLTSVASLPAEVVTHPVEIIAPELTQSQSSNSPQDTQTDQQSAASSVIETTSNPQLSIDTSALSSSVSTTPTTTTSTSTPVSTPLDPAVPEVVPYVDPADEVVTVNQSQAILVSVQVPAIDPVVQFVPTDIVPKEKYTFTLDTVAIPTKPDVNSPVDDSKKKVAKPLVTAMPRFSLDSNTGNLSVSGKCSDPYFVVLVYGNAADYDTDPSSYVFNKAFDCVNGSYFYSLSDLPPSITKGDYYILIGGQGQTGSWKPITALTPVTIEKETFYDTAQ